MSEESDLPFVSVIVPMHNERRHIERCLKSLGAQDYPRDRFEVMAQADYENRIWALADIRFTNIPGEQWERNMKDERGKRPCYEYNKVRIRCKRVINDMRDNRPQGKVRPVECMGEEEAQCRNHAVHGWYGHACFTLLDLEAAQIFRCRRIGRTPKEGEVMRIPTLARTLSAIAEGGSEAFYKGELADKIAAFVQEQGGWLSTTDMAAHTSDWEEPISTDYRGVTCWECPPSGHGVAALEALNIAEGFDLKAMGAQSPDTYHHLIESMRLAFADAFEYIADPGHASVPTATLVSKDYARTRRALIYPKRAMDTVPYGRVHGGSDTVYISSVDGEGNACSFIYSIYANFGTGMVVPGTGIALHNRGSLFSLDSEHRTALAPGKRPYHTIIPGMATINGELYLCYGVMGAFMQPQGHLQVISNVVDFGMDPQEALNALRFAVSLDDVALEEGISPHVVDDLAGRGHRIRLIHGYHRGITGGFGGAQLIQRDPETGVLRGGSEPRKDGCAIGW